MSESGNATSATSNLASNSNIYGVMADVGNYGGNATGYGPTLAAAGNTAGNIDVSSWGNGLATVNQDTLNNLQNYGTSDPSMFERALSYYDRFNNGMGNSLGKAYDKFGNNPETYGFAYGKLAGLAKPPSGMSVQPANINVNYQQPDNPYLRKRGY